MKRLGIHIYIILALLAVALSTQIARAQNNLYKIDDECYKVMATMKYSDKEEVYLKKCSLMYETAIRKHDKKAQTIAVCQELLYHDHKHDIDKIRKTAQKLRNESQKTGYKQYYYFAYKQEIAHLLEHDVEASMKVAQQMLREANEDTYPYGKFSCYQALGDVYGVRQNVKLSTEYYNKALEISPSLEPRQRTSIIHGNLATLSKNYNEKIGHCRDGLKEAIDASDSLLSYEQMCITYGIFNKKEEFNKCYRIVVAMNKKLNRGVEPNDIATAYKAAFDKDYEMAFSILDNVTSHSVALEAMTAGEIIANRAGDGELALYYAKEIERFKTLRFNTQRGYEFAELNDLIENEYLRSKKAEQDRNHALLALEAKNMETKQRQLEEETRRLAMLDMQIERKNEQIEADNREREEALRVAKVKKEYKKEVELQREQEYTLYTLAVVIGVLALVAVIIVALLLYYRHTGKNLLRYAKVLHRARNEAQDAIAMKNIFIQNMSHEIRTPLNAVMGFSQLMTIPGLPLSEEEKVEYAEHILNNSKMLTMLVDDILNIAEIEKGSYSVKMVESPVNEILAAAISTAEYRAQDGVKIYYTSDVADDYKVITDPRRTQQVLINFLTNACKHTDKGSIHLHLSLSETPGFLNFSVSDTGCGIPKEQAENIFERFTKLNDFKQGTGLGLNICRLISQKMGGKVYCDTNYTNGARFVFLLPLILPKSE